MTAVRATCIGAEALRALRPGRRGRVEAVFERSFYMHFDDDWICVGDPALCQGPINLLAGAPVRRLGALPGQHCCVAGGAVRIGQTDLVLGSARSWQPRSAGRLSSARIARGLDVLAATMDVWTVTEGLGGFARKGYRPEGVTAVRAEPAMRELSVWMEARGTAPPPGTAIRRLLGLGPGLTPSGDDVLAGMIATLRLIGAGSMAAALWAEIEKFAPCATSALSAAHLRAAYRCGLCEPVHDALCAMISGEPTAVSSALAALDADASTSPFDALAGCAMVLRHRPAIEFSPKAA